MSARSLRPDLAKRAFERLHRTVSPTTRASRLLVVTPPVGVRCKTEAAGPAATIYEPNITRWHRYEDPAEVVTQRRLRNPLNYFERERQRIRHNQYLKRRMVFAGTGLAACIVAQVFLIFTFGDESAPQNKDVAAQAGNLERLDAREPREGEPGFPSNADGVHVVGQKPGVPGVALDEYGNELVETGNSTIPYFPKTIRLPTTPSQESARTSDTLPAAASANAGREDEEYSLLGHGIRTVSFLRIQVYYLGVYVRTSDLPELQRRFVSQANASATSLIPAEKQALREKLLSLEKSQEVWDAVLRGEGIKSAVRIVPVKNTDFNHLRDGWVRGITGRTQEATARALKEGNTGPGEYDDERFGQAIGDFKGLFGGRGKAPVGSVVIMAREGDGTLSLAYQHALSDEEKKKGVAVPREEIGKIHDERIGRLVWLGYLGGTNVSSEAARKSVVDGVMELVERPVGTVGIGIS
ncbi:MAG: hypothetical protein Q9162_006140 [Coniocarpon cinnabarinum]